MAKSATAQIMDENSLGGKLKAWPQRTKSFLQDVRTEMKHVSYPSRKEVRATTIVVVITVALFGLYFYLVDMGIGRGIDWVFHHFTK